MHIFYLNARYMPEGVGGPAHSTRFLAEQMVRDGHRATVFCRSSKAGVGRERIAGVDILRVGLDLPVIQAVSLYREMIEVDRPDVIHVLFPREFPLNVLAQSAGRLGIPLVQTLLSFNLMCRHSFVRNGRNCVRQCPECRSETQIERAYCGQIAAAVGISQYMLELHEREGLFTPSTLKRVIPQAYEPVETVQREAVPPVLALRLGYLGRLDPLKGLDVLLETLTGPVLTGRKWSLQIAGQGAPAYVERLKQKYPDPRIQFLGFVRPDQLLNNIDVLVAPALWQEPLGRIILEAYAHGLPVIASRRGGQSESVEPGRTGYLFEPDEPGSLEQTLLQCLTERDSLPGMGAQAFEKWKQTYTPRVVGAQYLEVYGAVVAKD